MLLAHPQPDGEHQEPVTNTGFTYDNAGNLTFDGLLNYTWDAENHLKSTNGVNYTYDGDLRRVEKSNGKLYWYSGGQVLEETDLSGNLLNDYVYLAGQRIARRDSSGNVFYYYTDPVVGSTLAIYQASGSLCYQGIYYPFGGEKVYTNTCAQNYKFTGLGATQRAGWTKRSTGCTRRTWADGSAPTGEVVTLWIRNLSTATPMSSTILRR